ncbi:MAG: type VI secretion system baseplate subunit TssF [Fibrobacterota bacterium]|nr:type VI secretion system baseplate subunit TssF [Fibrobacterota bacterium]QQS05707.1 MAG: type VI secretion system baseplate subunit TssF [Fibrobacterota bacterium]
MSDLKRLYDEEMRYLLASGREYSRRHPDFAQILSMEEVERRDPYLERLFQNFAFLSARLRSDMDQSDDDSAGELLEQVAHGLELPLPGVSLLQFQIRSDIADTAKLVPRGSTVQSAQVGKLERPAQFTTTEDCPIHPLKISGLRLLAGSLGQGLLEWTFSTVDNLPLAQWPARITLHLAGDTKTAWAMHHWLVRRVHSVEIDPGARVAVRVEPATDLESYSPISAESARRLLSLRDFLCVDDRFRRVELVGLDQAVPEGTTQVRVRVFFQGILPPDYERTVDEKFLRINAVTAVNGYVQECEPYPFESTRTEYPVIPRDGEDREILDLVQILGASVADPTRTHHYTRSWAFRQFGRKPPEDGSFRVRRRPNRSGGMKTSVSVSHPWPEFHFDDEYLSVHAWVCDGDAPRDNLRPQDINEPLDGIPAGLPFASVERPSQVFRPSMGPQFRWRLFSHFQRTFRDLLEPEGLRDTLRLLLWDPRAVKRPLVDAIQRIDIGSSYRLEAGIPRPICQLRLSWNDPSLTPDAWDRIGQCDEFCRLLFALFLERVPPGMELSMTVDIPSMGTSLEHKA